MSAGGTATVERRRLTVRGIVQGVGFRPFVYGLALRLHLAGFVGNDSRGVFIEIEGASDDLDRFEWTLRHEAPPLAHVQQVRSQPLASSGERRFTIVESKSLDGAATLISPDLATCEDCLRELFDPQDRRYGYPFINCTNCGPRFTIIKDLPYDRPLTSMAGFTLCAACAREYRDPRDRRYHAQPIACPECGPQIWLERGGAVLPGREAIETARQALEAGAILAIKGLGGFHLACNAASEEAVQTLRQRKGRGDRPFAVMAQDMEAIRRFARVSAQEEQRLLSRERPIVLLRKRRRGLAEGIAPGNDCIGAMLPYTPLHHLLVGQIPLVMTSGNRSGEPIETDNQTAQQRLAPLVDGFLLHDRPIHVPCDDSVVRVFGGADLPLRRSRGFAPLPVQLPFSLTPVLAAGAELKNTVCISKDDQVILSQHIGDMENLETREAFIKVATHLQTIFRVRPERVICDLHPGYFSSRWAAELATRLHVPLQRVQHHHAHIAAVMAEQGLDGSRPVIGFAFDGTGYGPDQAIWGGEVLIADYRQYRRAAHLRYLPLPGGDAAIKHPYRCALAYLHQAGIAWDEDLPPVAAATIAERRVLQRQCESGLYCTPTSSMGRLFDAVAALIGLRQSVSFEAQAAIELEALLSEDPDRSAQTATAVQESDSYLAAASEPPYRFAIDPAQGPDGCAVIDPAPVLAAIVADLRDGVAAARISARFHHAVAALVATLSLQVRREEGLDVVALSGGVFQNVHLLALTAEACTAQGFTVITHHLVPPNDGGLALGQAVLGGRC